MADLTSLIERIEAATEGSRELDARIACFLDKRSVFEVVDNGILGRHVLGRHNNPPHDICVVSWASFFTTSIDAALTLKPEGYAVTGLMIWPGERSSLTLIETRYRPFGKDRRMSWVQEAGCRQWPGNGATAPLALLAAILRARQTEPRHDES